MSAITKPGIVVGGEYEKLPKIGAGTTTTTTISVSKPTNVSQDCVVPFIENNSKSKMTMMIISPFIELISDLFCNHHKKGVELKSLKDDKLRKFDNCLPDDLILSLKQAEQPREYLGPSSKKSLAGVIKPTIPVCNHLNFTPFYSFILLTFFFLTSCRFK